MTALAFALLFFAPPDLYVKNCAACHGDAGQGGAQGPGLASNPRVAQQTTDQLIDFLKRGNTAAGMPAFNELPADDLRKLAHYLHGLNNETFTPPPVAAAASKVNWRDPQPGDWLTYDGNYSANRFSPLAQINRQNVAVLKLKWVYPIQHFGLEVTPLEAGGVMYVTGPNQVIALNALTGEPVWRYSRPQTPGLTGDSKLGTNRGVAILRDKVFFETDNAHLIALDRSDGHLLWDVFMGEEPQHYGGTMAPLIVDDMVIAGVAGADHGIRGFVAAFQADNGALRWRHWTIPRRGETASETWQGSEPSQGGGSTWLTGSYDAATKTLYWPTGNPFPDSDDHDRPGDNLFSDSILALDVKTGALKWHYQFTPHDLMDRDATEPPVLVDTVYQGKPAKLLLHADRNGFFYVLDRTDGHLLLAKPFLRRVDWAKRIAPDGRPEVIDPEGCPSDAANWSSAAFSEETRLYYFMALEECTGKPTGYPDQTGQRFLRAVNIDTGSITWEIPQPGAARAKTWTGVLATASGLIFYGQPNGGFAAVDQRDGTQLWRFPTNVRMKAPPMTFTVGDAQFIAVAAGPNILCFGL